MEIAPTSKEFLTWLFTDLRRDLAERVRTEGPGGPDPENAASALKIFDSLLTGLAQGGVLPDDETVREYVAGLAQATDKDNEYERVSLEHRALAELVEALAKRK
jgi:hypothetical protein